MILWVDVGRGSSDIAPLGLPAVTLLGQFSWTKSGLSELQVTLNAVADKVTSARLRVSGSGCPRDITITR